MAVGVKPAGEEGEGGREGGRAGERGRHHAVFLIVSLSPALPPTLPPALPPSLRQEGMVHRLLDGHTTGKVRMSHKLQV
jgi:hypothetical protein